MKPGLNNLVNEDLFNRLGCGIGAGSIETGSLGNSIKPVNFPGHPPQKILNLKTKHPSAAKSSPAISGGRENIIFSLGVGRGAMKLSFNQIFKTPWLQKRYKQSILATEQFQVIVQSIIDYSITVKDVVLNLSFHLLFLFIGLLGFLYSTKLLWVAYQSSPVGQKYTQFFIERSYAISEFLSQNILGLSIQIIWISFSTCFSICCLLRFFHITTLLYDSRRLMIKVLLFGLPLSLISGWNLYQASTVIDFNQCVVLMLLPTLFLFQKCFWATSQLIPEFMFFWGDLKKIAFIVKGKFKSI